jgi:hypothetical protein
MPQSGIISNILNIYDSYQIYSTDKVVSVPVLPGKLRSQKLIQLLHLDKQKGGMILNNE